MASTASSDFDLKEQIARIDKMQAELGKIQIEIVKIAADTIKADRDIMRVEQETKLAPWALGFTGIGAGAAIFAAGAAFTKLFLH